MKRFRLNVTVAITIFIAIAALALPKAQATMARGIYVNGEVHYLSVGADSKHMTISHQAGTVDPNFALTLGTAVSQKVDSCTPDLGGISMNGAVFDNKIFFAFTGNAGCKSTRPATGDTHLYVATYDLTNKTFVNPVKDLGAVHHTDTNTTISGTNADIDFASAAIVVFNNLLYVFADNGTYTSGDGVNWSSYPALPVGGNNMQPLDAITFYPPDADPLIMIIYGNYTTGYSWYASLYATTWNGQFGAASVLNGQYIEIGETNGSTYFNQTLGLFAGTASPAFAPQPGNYPTGTPQFSAGAKAPALQLFLGASSVFSTTNETWLAVRRLEYTYSKSGGQWRVDPAVFVPNGGYGYNSIRAFPWFTSECTAENNIQRQHLVINTTNDIPKNAKQNIYFTSDALVPQNTDIPLNCHSTGGTATNTGDGDSDQMATLRKYWTLVGMVMGSPPFAVNNAQDFEIAPLSNVTYGQSQTSEVSNSQETENSVMVSAGITVQAGIEHVFGVKDQVDSSYKHAWESANEKSTTSTLSYGFTLGTENASTDPNDADQIGTMGWAIFHVPTIVVQDYALYAYDYDVSAMSGTALNQDIHTTQVNPADLSYIQVAFELANPGGPNDSIPGLMSGIAPLTKSTDFTGWKQGWESNSTTSATNHFTTLLGDSTAGEPKINTITFVNGSNGRASFSQDIETVTTTGQTSNVEVSNQTSLEFGTEVKGFKADLKVGYDGHFSNSVTNTATLGSDVEAVLGMPTCYEPACIKTLTVQPYLLQATDANAPWVPTAYNSLLPWAMHWKIVSYTTVGGGRSGVSPPADQATGTIVGGSEDYEKASGSGGSSSYSLRGGKMMWQEDDGTLKPIPMTAREFVPDLGVSLKLNGYTWSSSQAGGKWSRRGNIWTFRTNKSVKSDIVSLKLNFTTKTWHLDLSKADLSPFLKVSEGKTQLGLNINGKYEFYFDLEHEVKGEWDHNPLTTALAPNRHALSLSRYNGSFEPSAGKGTVTLEGDLPADLQHFGDISFLVNGRQINMPLISHKNYAKALAEGRKLVVNAKRGLKLSLDFGKKKWRAHFNGKIDPLLIPRSTVTTIQVKVGGELYYSGEHTVRDYSSKLKYVNPD